MKHTRSLPHASAVPTASGSREHALPRPASERLITTIVLFAALFQGLLYLILLPPWQHYDEPTHFEYAWLAANRPGLPHMGDVDQNMRRDVAASMIEHQFFWNLPKPALLTDGPIEIGISELGHPPAYYLLASLPLRLTSHLDITSQLYVARVVSLLLLLLTIAIAAGLMRDLTPDEHPLRWAVPLALALLPPFVDLMTAVNNDAGAVAVFSLFLWGAVRTIRFGLNWRRLAWIFGAALLAVATKNTAAIALPLAPLACLVGFWAQRGWRWRWLAATALGLAVAMLAAIVSWGDAAYWYRGSQLVSQDTNTRVQASAAPFGSHAIMLETAPGVDSRSIVSPLLPQDIGQVAGHTITMGGWLWADRPATVSAPRLIYQTPDMAAAATVDHALQLTTRPTFVAWTFTVPRRTYVLNYSVLATVPAEDASLRLFLDGALIVDGAFPADTLPVFDDASARSGTWAGQRFTNLVRNASGEEGWPRLRPWFDHVLGAYIHRPPSQLMAALLDLPRIAPVILPYLVRPAADGLIGAFAWNNVRLADPIWLTLAGYLALLALAGCLRWLLARRAAPPPSLRPALMFLGLVGLLIWANTILRPLPLLGEIYVVPAARYTFPAIIVTGLVIVGGWWALWPRKLQLAATVGLIAGLLALNGAAIASIASYYRAIPHG